MENNADIISTKFPDSVQGILAPPWLPVLGGGEPFKNRQPENLGGKNSPLDLSSGGGEIVYFWSVFGNNPTFRYIFEPKMNQKSKFFARAVALASIIPSLFLKLEFIKFEFITELRTISTQIYHISSMIFSILTLDRSSGKFSPKIMRRSSWRILRLLRSGVFTRFRKEKARSITEEFAACTSMTRISSDTRPYMEP